MLPRPSTPKVPSVPTLCDFTATTLTGEEQALAAYAGKVALVVNTASQCGFTPQFEGLEALYESTTTRVSWSSASRATSSAARSPATTTRSRVLRAQLRRDLPDVRQGRRQRRQRAPALPVAKAEKGGLLGDEIKWNFTKFLVGRDGHVIKRYGSTTEPEKHRKDIKEALAA